jgi:two-component system, cell cycle response regulator
MSARPLLSPPKPIQVLLVEDDPADASLLQEIFNQARTGSFALTTRSRLSDALQVASESSFDVVLLDLTLPDSVGLETVTTAVEHMRESPIVVLTGQDDEIVAMDAVRLGAQDCVVKGDAGYGVLTRSLRYAIERKHAERQLAYMATHDQLTGLTNRALFIHTLEHALGRAGREPESAGLLIFDIDGFKSINDTYGHHAGDDVLIELARRFEATLRDGDLLARLGGDEFGVVLGRIQNARAARTAAERLRAVVDRAPFRVENSLVQLTVSVGYLPLTGNLDVTETLKRADAAMYRAKREGRNRTAPYQP